MRILVIRLSSIGDVILTTPILKAFKEKYPESIIDFLVLKNFKDSIEGSKYIDNLILFDKKKYKGYKGIKVFTKGIKENNYDYVFDLHSKLRSIAITKFLNVKSFRYNKRVWWKSLLVKMKLIKYSADNTIIKNYFGAFESFDIKYKGEDIDFPFKEKDLKKVIEYKNYVVMAPGASKETKKWTPENFGELAKEINKTEGKQIILIGSDGDIKVSDKINEVSGNVCINLCGKLSLKESGALISKADYLVTNDSGPFHIGRGVKTKSFVLFGPTDPNMFEYDEYGILIYGNEKCSPCSLHGDKVCPKGHFNCMRKLKGKDVFDIIKKEIG